MSLSRRTILKSIAVAGTAAAFTGTVPGLKAAAQTYLPLRRSIGVLALDDPIVETYREFVAKMKEKDPSEAVSWVGFANVHGTLDSGFNLCPHGNWYFLPWHRAYLVMYEEMCRELTGNQDFAMPYWDWTIDRQLPKAFADQEWQGQPNPLFEPSRTIGIGSLPDDMVGETQVVDPLLADTAFEVFGTSRNPNQNSLDQSWITAGGGIQGPLENNPHNRVHCEGIGFSSIMCSGASPQDPIFMLHHGNIDRIWAVWNARGNSNSANPLWLDMEFQNHFINPDGKLYSRVVKDLQEVEPLGYTYGLQPMAVAATAQERNARLEQLFAGAPLEAVGGRAPFRVVANNDTAAEALRPLGVSLALPPELLAEAAAPIEAGGAGAEGLVAAPPTTSTAPQVLAFILDITPPEQPNTKVRVFVNCDYLSQEVPTTDPHYVTTFGFFGTEGSHGSHKALPSVTVDLTDTLRKLSRSKGLSGDTITVQLLPAPLPGVPLSETGTVVPARVAIALV